MLDEMTYRNVLKFAIFLDYENQRSFFPFSFHSTLFSPQMIVLVYIDIDQGISLGKK